MRFGSVLRAAKWDLTDQQLKRDWATRQERMQFLRAIAGRRYQPEQVPKVIGNTPLCGGLKTVFRKIEKLSKTFILAMFFHEKHYVF